jgi:hypothetical protein
MAQRMYYTVYTIDFVTKWGVMKKMMVALSLFVSLTVFSQKEKYSFKSLIGNWRNSKGSGLDVVDSNTIYIVHRNQRKLAKASLSDFTTNPVSLHLAVNDASHVITLKSLLLFVNDNMLQWQVFDTETRPVSFRYDKGDMLFLKKIEELNN